MLTSVQFHCKFVIRRNEKKKLLTVIINRKMCHSHSAKAPTSKFIQNTSMAYLISLRMILVACTACTACTSIQFNCEQLFLFSLMSTIGET